MGIHYNLILLDEYDWNYLNTSKEQVIENFKKDFLEINKHPAYFLAAWDGGMIWYVMKKTPDFYADMIYKYCDLAYYQKDNNLELYLLDPKPIKIKAKNE